MRIAIIGIGKMGSWFVSKLYKEHELAVYDINKENLSKLENVKLLSELSELKDFDPEILLNAVSLQNTINAFEQVNQYLGNNCVICDIASVKGDLESYYSKSGKRFLSMHPMFGPTHADMENLKKESVVFITGSDRKTMEFFKQFFTNLGLRIFDYGFEEHDGMMAYSLTTPFTASLVFAACVDKTAIPGTNFAKHKTIAEGLLAEDDHLLAEILFNSSSIKQIENINGRLELLKHIIKGKDYEEAKKFFDNLRKNINR